MPAKKTGKQDNKKNQHKGKKGGQASRTNDKQKKDMDDSLEYVEVDEFNLDDLPGSRS